VITYRGRSAAREVGKVLGFDPVQVDRLAKAMSTFEFDPAERAPAAVRREEARYIGAQGWASRERGTCRAVLRRLASI